MNEIESPEREQESQSFRVPCVESSGEVSQHTQNNVEYSFPKYILNCAAYYLMGSYFN
jgi:hypothetical protein